MIHAYLGLIENTYSSKSENRG